MLPWGGLVSLLVLNLVHKQRKLTVDGIGRFRITGGDRIAWHLAHPGVSDQDICIFLL